MANIRSFKELRVWQNAMDAAMRVYELSKRFPAEEKYSMTDQIRRSSRSVPSNIAEAWRKRRYQAAFVSKLNDAEGAFYESETIRGGWSERLTEPGENEPVGIILCSDKDDAVVPLLDGPHARQGFRVPLFDRPAPGRGAAPRNPGYQTGAAHARPRTERTTNHANDTNDRIEERRWSRSSTTERHFDGQVCSDDEPASLLVIENRRLV